MSEAAISGSSPSQPAPSTSPIVLPSLPVNCMPAEVGTTSAAPEPSAAGAAAGASSASAVPATAAAAMAAPAPATKPRRVIAAGSGMAPRTFESSFTTCALFMSNPFLCGTSDVAGPAPRRATATLGAIPCPDHCSQVVNSSRTSSHHEMVRWHLPGISREKGVKSHKLGIASAGASHYDGTHCRQP